MNPAGDPGRIFLSVPFFLRVLLLAGLSCGPTPWTRAWAEPRRPTDDAEVLERLPRVLRFAADQLSGLRAAAAQDPTDADAAARLAAVLLEIARREDDPRFLGQARAALARWWGEPAPPVPVLRLRAKLRERDHDYAGALADLGRVLAAEPGDAQALVETANLRYVTGDYAASGAAVDRLEAAGEGRAAAVAGLPLRVATGEAGEARAAADRLLADPDTPPAVLGFADVVGGDAARALGDDADAERRFRVGLARGPADAYLLRAWADFLLDRGRPEEALAATAGRLGDTGLLLRHALAAQAAGDGEAAAAAAARLADRFREIRLRGGTPHGRYEARFLLAFGGDPDAALAVALENWARQKQARDTRNLLEAALAAGRPGAAAPAIRFLRESGTRDADLDPLVRALEAGAAR